jgi:hypothetical protein
MNEYLSEFRDLLIATEDFALDDVLKPFGMRDRVCKG